MSGFTEFEALRPWPANRSQRGITLLELMVVISIIAILAASLVSGLHTLSGGQDLSNSVDRVVRMVTLARNRAIMDQAVYHVRAENRNFNDQMIRVYRFPRLSDALQAGDEEWVFTNSIGWNVRSDPESVNFDPSPAKAMLNYVVATEKLAPEVVFETNYDPGQLIKANRKKAVVLKKLHAVTVINPKPPPMKLTSFPNLFYSGNWRTVTATDPYMALDEQGVTLERPNLVPKLTPSYMSTPLFPAEARLLYFNPDGTAPDSFLFILRNENQLRYVHVWPSGLVATGSLTTLDDFKNLTRANSAP